MSEVQSRVMLTRVQSRKAEDALRKLSQDANFAFLTRTGIAGRLTTELGFLVVPNNLRLLAEAVEVVLPANRGNSSLPADFDLRLRRLEDALTFVLKNFGTPASRGTLDQLKIVTDNWLAHLSTSRPSEE